VLPKEGGVTVYAGARVADALNEVTEDMTLYKGVRLAQVLEAFYEQGLRDGRRQVFDVIEKAKQLPTLKHRNPGRPTKARSASKRTARARNRLS
jgi:hypothetical protein